MQATYRSQRTETTDLTGLKGFLGDTDTNFDPGACDGYQIYVTCHAKFRKQGFKLDYELTIRRELAELFLSAYWEILRQRRNSGKCL